MLRMCGICHILRSSHVQPHTKSGSEGNLMCHISANLEHQYGYYYKGKTFSARCFPNHSTAFMLVMMKALIRSFKVPIIYAIMMFIIYLIIY